MISDEELDLMKRQNERNAKYLHRMGRDGVRANRHRTALLAEVDRLRAEIERLRAALVLGSEVLASHQGSPQREWHSGGAWLYPGDSINVVRAPLPEIKVEP